jgi:hypothetical protein
MLDILLNFILISILLTFGSMIVYHRNKLKTTTGIAAVSVCGNVTPNTSTCNTPFKYTVNGQDYSIVLNTGVNQYNVGDQVTLYYNPDDSTDVEYAPVPQAVGWVMIGIAILLLLLFFGMRFNYKKQENNKQYSWSPQPGSAIPMDQFQ